MITINPSIDYFTNDKEKTVIIFLKNSTGIYTLNNSAYFIFNELNKKQPKNLAECQQLAIQLSLTDHVLFSTLDKFIELKFISCDFKKSDYSNFIKKKNDKSIETTILKSELEEILYQPDLVAFAAMDGDGGGSDNGFRVPPFHPNDGY